MHLSESFLFRQSVKFHDELHSTTGLVLGILPRGEGSEKGG